MPNATNVSSNQTSCFNEMDNNNSITSDTMNVVEKDIKNEPYSDYEMLNFDNEIITVEDSLNPSDTTTISTIQEPSLSLSPAPATSPTRSPYYELHSLEIQPSTSSTIFTVQKPVSLSPTSANSLTRSPFYELHSLGIQPSTSLTISTGQKPSVSLSPKSTNSLTRAQFSEIQSSSLHSLKIASSENSVPLALPQLRQSIFQVPSVSSTNFSNHFDNVDTTNLPSENSAENLSTHSAHHLFSELHQPSNPKSQNNNNFNASCIIRNQSRIQNIQKK